MRQPQGVKQTPGNRALNWLMILYMRRLALLLRMPLSVLPLLLRI